MNTFTPATRTPTMALSHFDAIQGREVPEATPLQQLADVLRRRWLLLLACSLAATTLAGAVGLTLSPVYTARAQVVVTPPVAPSSGGVAPRPDDTALTIETEVSALSSRDHVNRVLDDLVQSSDFPIASFAREGRISALQRSVVSAVMGGFVGARIESLLSPEQAARLRALGEPPAPARRREQILDEMERNLKVSSEPRSRVISVRYTAPSASLAALVANTVVETYITAQTERKRDDIRRDLDRLDRQLPELRNEVEAANAAIRSYRLDHAVLDAANAEQQEQQAVVLKAKTNATRIALAANEAEQAALAELRQGARAELVQTQASPRLTALQEQERRLLGASPGAGEGASSSDAARRQLRREIVAEVDLASAGLKEDAAQLADRWRAFQRQLESLGTSLRDMQPATDHLRQLVRLADVKRRIYEDELLVQQTLIRKQDLVLPDLAFLSVAASPQKPASTNPILFLPPAFVLGLLAAGAAALWSEGRDSTLRNARMIEGVIGIPYGGFVLPPTRRRALARPTAPLHAAALRTVFATTLSPEAARNGRKTVLVTASVAGEASLDLAMDLSVYAARLLPRVLLMNLDFRNPIARQGLTQRLRGGPRTASPAPDGMAITRPVQDVPLDVLSVDSQDPDPVAFLLGRDLREAFQHLRERYDYIVVHAGPILETTEAQLLAGEADRILLAIRWGHTPRRLVENALDTFKRLEGPLIERGRIRAVLTRVKVRNHLAFRFGDSIEAMARSYRRRRFA